MVYTPTDRNYYLRNRERLLKESKERYYANREAILEKRRLYRRAKHVKERKGQRPGVQPLDKLEWWEKEYFME